MVVVNREVEVSGMIMVVKVVWVVRVIGLVEVI